MSRDRELKELHSYCNAMFVLMSDFLPVCPVKNKVMWERAIKQGNKLADKRRREFLNKLADDIEDVLLQHEDNKDLPLRFMIEPADAHSIINYIRNWKPKEQTRKE